MFGINMSICRRGGYDHFIVAGTCHPYSICSTMAPPGW